MSKLHDFISQQTKEIASFDQHNKIIAVYYHLQEMSDSEIIDMGFPISERKFLAALETQLRDLYASVCAKDPLDYYQSGAVSISSGPYLANRNKNMKCDSSSLSGPEIALRIQNRQKKIISDLNIANEKLAVLSESLNENEKSLDQLMGYGDELTKGIKIIGERRSEVLPDVKKYRATIDVLQTQLLSRRPHLLILVALQDVKLLLNHLQDLGPLVGGQNSQLTNFQETKNVLRMMEFLSTYEIPDAGGDTLRLTNIDASMADRELEGLSGEFILDYCQGKKFSSTVDVYLQETLTQLEAMGASYFEDLKSSNAFVQATMQTLADIDTEEEAVVNYEMKEAKSKLKNKKKSKK